MAGCETDTRDHAVPAQPWCEHEPGGANLQDLRGAGDRESAQQSVHAGLPEVVCAKLDSQWVRCFRDPICVKQTPMAWLEWQLHGRIGSKLECSENCLLYTSPSPRDG